MAWKTYLSSTFIVLQIVLFFCFVFVFDLYTLVLKMLAWLPRL